MANASPFTVDLAKQFAWLLRKDVRDASTSKDDPSFNEWWLIKGRQEFLGWIDSGNPQELEHLFSPNGSALVAGINFEVPKIVYLLAKYRLDAIREFSKDGEVDRERFLAWVVIRGLIEHHLIDHIPIWFISSLDQVVPNTIPEPNESSEPPGATLLMYLVWILMDKATQDSKNLFTSEGRMAFLSWFFNVVKPLGLSKLVPGRWKAWLLTPIQSVIDGPEIPRFSKIAWTNSAELRKQIVIKEHADYLKLKEWARIARQPKGTWDWLTRDFFSIKKDLLKERESAKGKDNQKPFGFNIYGFAYGELGIGEDLRMAVECCRTVGIPYHVVNVDAGATGQADMYLKGQVIDLAEGELPPYNTNLFCLPAFDTVSRVFMQKGASVFEGFRNIGWWPWELAVFPKAWQPYAFELVDEVWASSQFLFDMYSTATEKPVRLVPLAVSVDRMKSRPRDYYGLPDKNFLFLYIFDFNSSVARKNPLATVKAFRLAFNSKERNVGLVLKTMNANPNNIEWQAFIKECRTDTRIRLITDTLDRSDVLGLINVCDAYVSLHRAEGFGRTLAEAMLLGKPVVATGYSGNVDFINIGGISVDFELVDVAQNEYQWISKNDNAKWAEVLVDDAAKKILDIFINKNNFIKNDKKIKSIFSTKSIGEKITKTLE